jgi:hypothetical protein
VSVPAERSLLSRPSFNPRSLSAPARSDPFSFAVDGSREFSCEVSQSALMDIQE